MLLLRQGHFRFTAEKGENGLNDGVFTVELTMSGGTGKAHILSPVTLTVNGGKMTASVEWSSSKYELMVVGGENFYPVNDDGNSRFEIPVYTLEEPLPVQAETLAMSEPHLIDYELVFDAGTLRPLHSEGSFPVLPVAAGAAAVICVIIVSAVLVKKRKK